MDNSQYPIRNYYPWLSIGGCLTLITLLLINTYPLALLPLDDESVLFLSTRKLTIIVLILLLIISIELTIFITFLKSNRVNHKNLNVQLRLLSKSKKHQQQKALNASDQSDKLKSFISDKLVSYMDFDEKFIHFKGIASEVRHNGVISYDKVTSALEKAIQQQHFLSLYEQNNADEHEENQQTINALSNYQAAIDAMRYLWALLDLSTADNMSLHIGNQLIECEEHFYQLQLDSEKSLEATQSIPVSPTFYPQLAVLQTFALMFDNNVIKRTIALAKINPSNLENKFIFENEQYKITLLSTPELLGNHNHFILLLENLIKNALFFSRKSKPKQNSDRIIIALQPINNFARLSIYNRGPTISDSDKERLFNLGFSTRNRSTEKNKQYHGKGLGLFFVSEIIKGYQGKIKQKNVLNTNNEYKVCLLLANGERLEYKLITDENGLKAKLSESDKWEKEVLINHAIPIVEVFVSTLSNGNSEDHTEKNTAIIDPKQKHVWLEPEENFGSRWKIQIKPYKKEYQFSFSPLDIKGVCFDIELPTAESNLDC